MKLFKKTMACILSLVTLFTVLPFSLGANAEETDDCWIAYQRENVTYSKDGDNKYGRNDSLRIDVAEIDYFGLERTFSRAEKGVAYRVSAMVKTDIEQSASGYYGVYLSGDCYWRSTYNTCFSSIKDTKGEWKEIGCELLYDPDTGCGEDNGIFTVYLGVSGIKGTVWVSDFKIEKKEMTAGNEWNFLVLNFEDIDVTVDYADWSGGDIFKYKYTDKCLDIEGLNTMQKGLPALLEEMSGGMMSVRSFDIVNVPQTLRTVSDCVYIYDNAGEYEVMYSYWFDEDYLKELCVQYSAWKYDSVFLTWPGGELAMRTGWAGYYGGTAVYVDNMYARDLYNEKTYCVDVDLDSYLNVREGPGTNYGIISRLYYGSEVTVEKISNGWGYIDFYGVKGWVFMQYLKKKTDTWAKDFLVGIHIHEFLHQLEFSMFPGRHEFDIASLHSSEEYGYSPYGWYPDDMFMSWYRAFMQNTLPDGRGLPPQVYNTYHGGYVTVFQGEADVVVLEYVWIDYLGDVNFDGTVDAADAAVILEIYAQVSSGGIDGIEEWMYYCADVNFDGIIDASDASAVLEYYTYIQTGGSTSAREFFMSFVK